jgi:hypothetical protein
MSTFGDSLKNSMNQSVDLLLDQCEQIITSKCTDRASRGFGYCRFDWSVEFLGFNIDKKDIKTIVENLGLTIQWINDFGMSLTWVSESEIETYRKSRKDRKKERKEKRLPELPTIVEEKKDDEVDSNSNVPAIVEEQKEEVSTMTE